MDTEPFLKLDNTSVRLRDRLYLENTSWQINPNEHWAILGPNGSGKTTFAKSLFGAVPVVRGDIVYNFSNEDRRNPFSMADAIGYVSPELHRDIIERENLEDSFREFSGKIDEITTVKHIILNRRVESTTTRKAGGLDFTAIGGKKQGSEAPQIVENNAVEPGANHPVWKTQSADRAQAEKRLNSVAKKIGIEALLERNIRSLSTGEMNTALIAKALIKRPRLLILDEPFDGLDAQSRNALAKIINDLMGGSMHVILITHRFAEIVPNITHVLLLKHGKIFKSGKKEDVFTDANIDRVYEIEDRPIEDYPPKISRTISAAEKKGSPSARILIEMKNVAVKYGRQLILDQFNWRVKEGENWTILGPKGSGKSTVLTLILGDNLQAYANEIYLFGKRRGSGESIWDIKKQIGLISADLQIRQHKNINAFDVVCSGFFDSNGLYKRCRPEELAIATEWTHFIGIDELAEHKFGRLSHGQRQLVLIARAMVKSPEILILDEPFQGLDIKNRRKILDIFEYIGSQTRTNLIYVPNQGEEALTCITHVLNMDHGKAVDQHPLES
jgi:molybdate transport system ATP-binding protein